MRTPINKPAGDIPEYDWCTLSYSQQAYAEFVYEVLGYFDEVVRHNLGWSPDNIKINQGKNNLVIAFDVEQKRYLFRVPKYGNKQLQVYHMAAQQFSKHAFFPTLAYIDSKCMIEHFAVGQNLEQGSSAEAYKALAKALNKIHCLPAKGFGHLLEQNKGVDGSAFEHYMPLMTESIKQLSQLLPNQANIIRHVFLLWQIKLRSNNTPVVLCHGDLWSNNILYDVTGKHLTIIDWDTCGAYHREKDLHFLLSEGVPEKYTRHFFEHYDFDVDTVLMSWYRLTMNVIYYDPSRHDHFLKAANHFLQEMGDSKRLTCA